jgi:hypothetical protein
MPTYLHPNADGLNSFMVCAKNQKEACKLMRGSVGDFRRFGGRKLDPKKERDAEAIKISESKPGKVWMKEIDIGQGERRWSLYGN